MTDKAKRKLIVEQEADFLLAYYGKSSPTRLDRRASAIAAGYTPRMALWNANRLLKKYAERTFKECAEAVGINRPQLAVILKEVLETSEGKEALSSIRLMMANLGEQTDSASVQKNINVNSATMVIIGATPERLEALRRGGAPARELPPGPQQDAIDVAPIEEPASVPVEPPPAAGQRRDARHQTAADFTGRNLSERPKKPSY